MLVRFSTTAKANLNTVPVKAGTIIYVNDTLEQYFDISDNKRIQLTDIIYLDDDEDRVLTVAPLANKLYFVKSTFKFWMCSTAFEWTCLNPDIEEATTEAAGLMSAEDKAKLDGLATVATSGSYADLTNVPISSDGTVNVELSTTHDTALADVTLTNMTASGNVTINGDLVVNGDTVTINTETITTKDNMIELNHGEAGAGVTSGQSGLSVDRGSQAKYYMLFDETDDMFKVGVEGDLETISTREYVDDALNSKLDVTGTAAGAEKIDTTNWSIEQEGTSIVFKFDGVTVATLESSGKLSVSEIAEV